MTEKLYKALHSVLEEIDRCQEKRIPFSCMNPVYINAVEVLMDYEDEMDLI